MAAQRNTMSDTATAIANASGSQEAMLVSSERHATEAKVDASNDEATADATEATVDAGNDEATAAATEGMAHSRLAS